MKSLIIILSLSLMAFNAGAQNAMDSFRQFRQQTLSDYQGFRKNVLEGYADYLANAWKEYETFKGTKRDETPKPVTPVSSETTPPCEPSDDKPVITSPIAETPSPSSLPSVQPIQPVTITPTPDGDVACPYYGMTIKMPKLECLAIEKLTPSEVSATWRKYDSSDIKPKIKSLQNKIQSLGLNDWFAYVLVRDGINYQNRNRSEIERTALQHYILANMGYDVRLADCAGSPSLLFRTNERVYERAYIKIEGHSYYIYTANGTDAPKGGSLYTCELPSDVNPGSAMNMVIGKRMNINGREIKHTTVTYNDITVNLDVDVDLMEMLRHYPAMDISSYAKSNVCNLMREQLLNQIRPTIKGMSNIDAANKLLHFVQLAFAYATDGEQHGYEKPYFLEENFFYPKNDCEDRAILYAYLVRNLLGLDVHLIQYPGHECTAVCFNDEYARGDGYVYQEKTYLICDPTYIGAGIGQCMPDYRSTKPIIETW